MPGNRTNHKKGIQHPFNKLSENDIIEIIRLHKEEQINSNKIGKIFNVSGRNIRSILSGKIWIHITGIKREKK